MLITRQQIIDIFNAIKDAVEGVLTIDGSVDSTVQNWPTKQQVNLSQDGTDNKVDVDFPASQTVDGTVGVNSLPALPTGTNKIGDVGIDGDVSVDSLPALPAGTNAIGSVDVDNFPTSIEVDNLTGESLDVQVTGSIEEHMWVDGDAEPTPTSTRAIGLIFDPGTDDVVVKIWTGAAWEVM